MDFLNDMAWMLDAALYQRRLGELREQLQRMQNERDLANWGSSQGQGLGRGESGT